ncbi:DUF6279 family lipoprotein [Cognaticolwellia aestuarii]|uniref:DUF6279 family lipoprotein n=1 Tax=Cognaticolwellia aestuarii TaxID=329993 RepID=UPI000984AE2F|nr:DUF6279 family lipoprotein [Cognaticolwellia aestuarii]
MNNFRTHLLACILAIFVSGCGFRFIYNHLDWWANWYLDDYVTLTESQQQAFDRSFEALHDWHRTTQLPLYVKQLKALQFSINNDLGDQQVTENLTQLLEHWQNILMAVEPKLQPLAFSLSAKQKQQLLLALKAAQQEQIDDNEILTQQQWFEVRAEQQTDQLKAWFGRLSTKQKQQVNLLSQSYQRSFEPRMNYRQHWTNQFAELLNAELPEHQFKFEFYRLFVNGRSLRDDNLNAITKNNNQVFARIFVYMATSATDKQRKRINKKINKLVGDLKYLIAND